MTELRGKRKATREANLRLAEGLDDNKWTKATPYHWRRVLRSGTVIDFWPTTMRAQVSWYSVKDGCHFPEIIDNAYGRLDDLLKDEEANA